MPIARAASPASIGSLRPANAETLDKPLARIHRIRNDPRMSTSDRFVPASVAAHLSGVDPRTIRRWSAQGTVPSQPSSRGRLVDLAAVQRMAGNIGTFTDSGADLFADEPRIHADTADPIREPDRELSAPGSAIDPAAIEPFIQHIKSLEQQVLELAGRAGFYQARAQSLEERIALLEAPTSYGSGEAENSAVRASQQASDHGSSADPADPSVESRQSVPSGHTDESAAATTNHASWWRRWLLRLT